jgi:hypothetical protein
MDVGKAFTYMFEDKDWIVKILIGGGILLLGVLFSWVLLVPLIAAAAILMGYMLNTLRNVYDGNPKPLPNWENFGDLFVRGIMAIVGLLIWSLPVIILACCTAIPYALAGNQDRGSGAGFFSLVGTCMMCLTILVGIVISLFTYAPLTNFALNNKIDTFWDFRGNWNFIRSNFNNYIIAWLLGALVAGFIAGAIGSITCGLLSFFASFWAMLVAAHLFGQYARLGMMPADTSMLPPTPPPPAEPPTMTQGPMEPTSPA